MTKKAKVHLLDRDSEAIGRSQSLEDLKYARKTGATDTSFQHFIDDIPTENREHQVTHLHLELKVL